jgi:hypothetical protein
VNTLLGVVFSAQNSGRGFDLEAVESLTRTTALRAGASLLSHVVENESSPAGEATCECGQDVAPHDHRTKQVLTVLGGITVKCPYYVCSSCGRSSIPRDQQLDIAGTKFSPGVRRMMAVVGSETSFDKGSEQLQLLAGIEVVPKSIQTHAEAIGADIAAGLAEEARRAKQLQFPEILNNPVPILYIEMDGTGIPVVKSETEGRAGRQPGQPARTREVKLGCVFTQTGTDRDGYPIRDRDSTSYVASIETADEFGFLVYSEAWRRGWSHARKKVVIADGAPCNWNIADRYFPGAIQIVDLYHARQHLWELSGKLFPSNDSRRKGWATRMQNKLDEGAIEALVASLRRLTAKYPEHAQLLTNQSEYFQRNADRMRYPEFRRQGLFVGSGVIEAGCKNVIGLRLKRSGMFWTVDGANAILALRCSRLNGRFEDYWATRKLAA